MIMKRKIKIILFTCLVLFASVFIFTSCKHVHTEIIDPAVSPTCTVAGLTEGKHCSECNEVLLEQKTVDALGHTEVIDPAIAPTCTTIGLTEGKHCSVCNETLIAQITIDALNHDIENHNAQAPTCTEIGWEAYVTCQRENCSYTTYTEKEATGHSYASTWEKDAIHHWHKATCEHTGEISAKIEHEYGTDNVCDICEYERGIAVSGITLNHTSFAVMVGDVKTLVATVTPDDATNKKIMWTTSNPSVITVDENGVVVAIGAGNAIVYAVSEDGAKMAQCIVVVIGSECLHSTTRTERENIVDSTCKEAGTYDEVVYCSACGYEFSRTKKEISKKDTHTPVTDARVEPTFTETGLTEGSHCEVCGAVIVAQEVIPVKPSKSDLLSKTLTVNVTTISGSVSYSTNEFNFVYDISVTNNGVWVLSTDANGVHTIITKSAPLSEGNNVFYIHVENPDKTVTTYTVNIYRNHMYTVSFDTDGGTTVEPQYIEENYFAIAPSTTKVGYTFASWDYNFSTPITSDTTIKANWKANTNTAYKVEYYLENVDKNGYGIVSSETENLTGTTDTMVSAEQKTFEHFTFDASKSILKGNVNGDGGLVLKVYYTRNTYTVSTNRNNTKGGTVISGGIYAYDKQITLTATTNAGYTFLGWFEGEAKVCDTLSYTFKVDHTATYTAKWEANTDTAYTVEYYLENGDKNGYEDPIIENLTGTTDTMVSAEQKAFEHFTFDASKSILKGNVNGDGDLVLKVYYTRNEYTLSNANSDCGCISKSGSYTYGSSIEVTATVTKLGYEFVGWYSENELLSNSTSYIFTADKNVEARFSVKTEMANFDFTSTSTICSITGIKDKTIIEVLVPNYVTSISQGVFDRCTSLTSITIGAGVMELGGIIIGAGVMEIEDIIFAGCNSLTNIIVDENNQCYKSIDGNLYSKDGKTLVKYAIGKTDTCFIIPDTVTDIAYWAFYQCSTITSIMISNGVTSIGDYAFAYCTNLTSITIPESVTNIGESGTFIGCTSLTTVTIPDSVTSNLYNMFNGCTGLTSVTIGKNVTMIDAMAFSACTNLTSVTIGKGVTNVSWWAFSGCTSLTNVYFMGSPAEWSSITIHWNGNDDLINATRYYYSEEAPTDTTYSYWHYVDGVPTPWENN